MRIVRFPLEGLSRSGGIRVVVAVANALARDGLSPVLVVPDYSSAVPFPLEPGVAVEIVRTRLRSPTLRKLEYLARLATAPGGSADAAVATGFRTPWVLALARALGRSPGALLYLVQHYETRSQALDTELPLRRKLGRALVAELGYHLPLRQVAVSSWIQTRLPRPERAVVIPNGVDLETFRPGPTPRRPEGPLVVGCIGRRGRVKGWDVFREAMAIARSKDVDIRVATPSGPEAVEFDDPRAVVEHPRDDVDMVRFYRCLDVFVFPSRVEGFGLPVLEAMACGVPVLTADCGGIADFVTPENAVVVPPGDPAALARALDRMLGDSSLRARLTEGGLATARSHPMEACLARHVAVVKATLADELGVRAHG